MSQDVGPKEVYLQPGVPQPHSSSRDTPARLWCGAVAPAGVGRRSWPWAHTCSCSHRQSILALWLMSLSLVLTPACLCARPDGQAEDRLGLSKKKHTLWQGRHGLCEFQVPLMPAAAPVFWLVGWMLLLFCFFFRGFCLFWGEFLLRCRGGPNLSSVLSRPSTTELQARCLLSCDHHLFLQDLCDS